MPITSCRSRRVGEAECGKAGHHSKYMTRVYYVRRKREDLHRCRCHDSLHQVCSSYEIKHIHKFSFPCGWGILLNVNVRTCTSRKNGSIECSVQGIRRSHTRPFGYLPRFLHMTISFSRGRKKASGGETSLWRAR